jgi:hypothetical protein
VSTSNDKRAFHAPDHEFARLHPDDIEAIARRVVALLRDERPKAYLTAREIADRYGVSTDWVYDHAAHLEAVPMGTGKRPRLRFSATAVERFITEQAELRPPRSRRGPS